MISLRKHPFLLAPRRWGRSARETSSAAKSEEKRMFSQANERSGNLQPCQQPFILSTGPSTDIAGRFDGNE